MVGIPASQTYPSLRSRFGKPNGVAVNDLINFFHSHIQTVVCTLFVHSNYSLTSFLGALYCLHILRGGCLLVGSPVRENASSER